MKLTWKRFSFLAAIAGALLLSTAVVLSQNPPPRPDGPPGPRGPFGHGPHGPGPGGSFGPGPQGPGPHFGPLAGLNLTEAQQEQIRQIHESVAEQSKALHEQIRTLHESQSNQLTGTFDEAAVRAAAEARAKLHVELEVLHAKMMSQIANVLTPEQRAQWAERHEHLRQMGPPKPPAPPGKPEM